MSRPPSRPLQVALASIDDDDATTLQTRTVTDPETGRRTEIRIETGLWRQLEELAEESGTTWETLCCWALRDFPDTPPDHVMRTFADCVTTAFRTFGRLRHGAGNA